MVAENESVAAISSGQEFLGSPVVLVLVAVLWGVTNPLLKLTSAGLEDVKARGRLRQFLAEIRFLAGRGKYVAAFVANQMGSVLYFLALGAADLSLASPVTSALTFVFTHLCGVWLGEPVGDWRLTWAGVACVVGGVVLCMLDKTLT